MHAQETINGQNKDKMSQLSNRIDGLGDKNAGQDAKLSVLENMVKEVLIYFFLFLFFVMSFFSLDFLTQ